MAAYNDGGVEIARTPEWLPIADSFTDFSYPAVQPDTKSKKELVRLRNLAGAHYFVDVLVGLKDGELVPICKAPGKTDGENCSFYNSSYMDDIVQDFDNDGVMEVVEVGDEFPRGGGRGRPVLTGVYKYKDGYFEPQENASYNRIYSVVDKQLGGDLLSKSKWATESKTNYDFMKDVWLKGPN
jgi:hypothetical protein